MVPAGVILYPKPAEATSHDIVARVRRGLRERNGGERVKVGHAGTLDPMATGVLVVGIERATKMLGLLALETKSYEATIRLGQTTTTDDAEGETTSTTDASAVTDEATLDAVRPEGPSGVRAVMSATPAGCPRKAALKRSGSALTRARPGAGGRR